MGAQGVSDLSFFFFFKVCAVQLVILLLASDKNQGGVGPEEGKPWQITNVCLFYPRSDLAEAPRRPHAQLYASVAELGKRRRRVA